MGLAPQRIFAPRHRGHADCTIREYMSQTATAGLFPATESERKFLVDAETANDIWLRAGRHLQPQVRDTTRPVTYHRTTYFDTPDHAYFRGAGPVATRVRVREYATAAHEGEALRLMRPCFLELKQSANGLRHKSRLEIEGPELKGHLARFCGHGLLPCLTTWYRRRALTDPSEWIRMTLDMDLRYCAPQEIGAPCRTPESEFARASSLVLEIKTWGPLPSWLRALVLRLEEAADFSKFRAGMQAARVSNGAARGCGPSIA
jgi:hypothetical protein